MPNLCRLVAFQVLCNQDVSVTVLVTGATGFIGHWILEYLLERQNSPIRVLTRANSQRQPRHAERVEIVHADLRDLVSLHRAMEGVETVYHAAGIISFEPKQAELVRQVNYQGAKDLFDAALQAGVKKIVYTASIFGIGYAETPKRIRGESDNFNAENLLDIPYMRAKRDAELASQQAIEQGLPLVRLYPGLCLGPGDWHRSSTRAIDSWLHGRLPVVVDGGGICLMDVRDAALAHIAAMDHGIPGERYLATGHNLTLKTLFEMLSKITGRRSPLMLPSSISIPGAKILEASGIPLPVESDQARLMARYWWYDCRHALQKLQLEFRPLEETLKDTIEWLHADLSHL
jgi:dihydroflavonol-4-reductase